MAWSNLSKESVKASLNVVSSIYDDEIEMLIAAGKQYLSSIGVAFTDPVTDPEIALCITTYCKLHFGEPSNADVLQKSLDAQTAKLVLHNTLGWE